MFGNVSQATGGELRAGTTGRLTNAKPATEPLAPMRQAPEQILCYQEIQEIALEAVRIITRTDS